MKQFLRITRGIALIFLVLILFVASPVLWPVYLGIVVLRPNLLDRLWSYKIF